MKEFFKYVFATIVGVILSSIVIGLIFFGIIVGIISSIGSDETTVVKENTVLYLNLDQAIIERTPESSFNSFLGGSTEKSLGFYDIIKALKTAETDANIKAVYINVSAPNAGMATMLEVRNAILAFRKSKKPVIAYSETYTQGAYYLASAAQKVYLNPAGALEFKGLSSQLIFFKGALEKLGIEAQIIRVGNYKSAVEPFINTKMSEYNKKQVSAYIDGMYQTFLAGIATARNINKDSLHNIANNYKIQTPTDAVSYKMVDGLRYKDEILDELKKLTSKGKKDEINSVTINEYVKNLSSKGALSAANKIAVIYANGDIVGGEGSDEQIGSERISRAIRKARLDASVKAIVLRVNSGGGSALASDVMWREVVLAKKEKPVIASFGDVAASGGYYMACAADSIFVQPNTITGSIGVFGMIPNFENLFTNKLGLTFDGVKTGQYADIMSTNRALTPAERAIIQKDVNNVYDTFITKVANGRKKAKTQVDSLASGRVWVGSDAVKNGLADRLASFNDAINAAAKKAKVKDFSVVEYPEKIDPVKAFISQTKDKVSTYFVKKEFGEHYLIYKQMERAITNAGVQARMEYNITIK